MNQLVVRAALEMKDNSTIISQLLLLRPALDYLCTGV